MDNRIAELEQSVRALRMQIRVLVGVAALGVGSAMLGLADGKDAEPGVVRASMIVLESGGKTRAILMADGDGASLTLRRGDATTVLSSAEGRQGLVLRNSKDKIQSAMLVSPKGSAFILANESGEPMASLAASGPGEPAEFMLAGKSGKVGALLKSNEDGSLLSLYDAQGRQRTAVVALNEGGATLHLDENGKPR